MADLRYKSATDAAKWRMSLFCTTRHDTYMRSLPGTGSSGYTSFHPSMSFMLTARRSGFVHDFLDGIAAFTAPGLRMFFLPRATVSSSLHALRLVEYTKSTMTCMTCMRLCAGCECAVSGFGDASRVVLVGIQGHPPLPPTGCQAGVALAACINIDCTCILKTSPCYPPTAHNPHALVACSRRLSSCSPSLLNCFPPTHAALKQARLICCPLITAGPSHAQPLPHSAYHNSISQQRPQHSQLREQRPLCSEGRWAG